MLEDALRRSADIVFLPALSSSSFILKRRKYTGEALSPTDSHREPSPAGMSSGSAMLKNHWVI